MSKLELDEDLVRKLSDLLEETGLSEIEYEVGGQRIRVARNAVAHIAAAPVGGPVAVHPQGQQPDAKGDGANGEAVPENAITAPMVGTAYVSAEPGTPPFVSVGDQVREGQTLLIIEAMKVMNPIPCPKAGRVSRVLVHDGQPVEYGEPLMVID